MRAGERGHDSARRQQPQRAQVQLVIAAQGGVLVALALREGGRIEHDEVEGLALLLVVAQEIEDVGLHPIDVEFSRGAVAAASRSASADWSIARQEVAPARIALERKRALVGEAIEHAPARAHRRRRPRNFPPGRDRSRSSGRTRDRARSRCRRSRTRVGAGDFAVQHACARAEGPRAGAPAHRCGRARRGTGFFDQQARDDFLALRHGERERLHHEHVAVAIDDQAGQLVRFRPDEAAGAARCRTPMRRR